MKNHSQNSTRHYGGAMPCFKLAIAFLFLLASPLSALADMVTIDFRQLYTEEAQEDLSASRILRYLNGNESTAGIVEAIPYSEFTFGYSKGLSRFPSYEDSKYYPKDSEGHGALYILATDSVSKEDTGGITFRIAPKYRHRNTNLNIYLFKDADNTGSGDQTLETKLEVAINGGEYEMANITREDPYSCTFNIKPDGAIIKEFSIRVPNAFRNSEGELLSDSYLTYFLALTHINLYYSADEKSENVTAWQFEQPEHTAYLSDAANYSMPVFTVQPAEAAEFAEFTSSDPEIAEIKDSKVVLKASGKATITAVLPENPLFKPNATYQPASYTLTIEDSTSTAIEQLDAEYKGEPLFYDLHGREVKGKLGTGIYIKKQGNKIEKIYVY